jgi:membrane-bound serine protease (ClpP class)
MKRFLAILLAALELPLLGAGGAPQRVYVIPVREEIGEPLLYLVRRGVKEAIQNRADTLVLDMNTNGGEVGAMLEIIEAIHEFKGPTVTYVNKTAFSAGALIAIATGQIYMAPESVIGAAAPVMLSPGGGGAEAMSDTVERKTVSAISAKIRAYAQRHGHNPEVLRAMIDKTKELKIDGQVVNKEGDLLTLTNIEAEKSYGKPPKPLLSLGTVAGFPELWRRLGADEASVTRVQPTGAETLAGWIISLRAILLMIGVIGLYIEFKTPGVVLPGVIGGVALVIYFFGGYVAGLSGLEWLALFFIGLVLVAIELFVFPGTMAIGMAGAVAMLVALVMAMVDLYPGGPVIPTLPQLRLPMRDILVAFAGGLVSIAILARFLPKTRLYDALVSHSVSGARSVDEQLDRRRRLAGQTGVAISTLRPGGKAQFGDEIVDVISDGDMLEKGAAVRVIDSDGGSIVVVKA